MVSSKLLKRILSEYTLPRSGFHGVTHWGRVFENGARLAEQTGAHLGVVQLFAVLHDSRRLNEGWDEGHGRRGAELAVRLRDEFFRLSDSEFDLLYTASPSTRTGRRKPTSRSRPAGTLTGSIWAAWQCVPILNSSAQLPQSAQR